MDECCGFSPSLTVSKYFSSSCARSEPDCLQNSPTFSLDAGPGLVSVSGSIPTATALKSSEKMMPALTDSGAATSLTFQHCWHQHVLERDQTLRRHRFTVRKVSCALNSPPNYLDLGCRAVEGENRNQDKQMFASTLNLWRNNTRREPLLNVQETLRTLLLLFPVNTIYTHTPSRIRTFFLKTSRRNFTEWHIYKCII